MFSSLLANLLLLSALAAVASGCACVATDRRSPQLLAAAGCALIAYIAALLLTPENGTSDAIPEFVQAALGFLEGLAYIVATGLGLIVGWSLARKLQ